MQGPHYALVVSQSDMNQTGCGLVCPITTGAQEKARADGLTVTLMGTGTQTQGVILVPQVKFVDFAVRGATFTERAPSDITEEVIDKIAAVVGF